MSTLDTVGKLFLKRIEKSSDDNAIGTIQNKKIEFISYKNYGTLIQHLSLSFAINGIKQNDKVSICANTSDKWHYIDMACLCSGIVVVPVYHTHTTEDIRYIVKHSESKVIVLEDEAQINKFLTIDKKLESLEFIISLTEISTELQNKIKEQYIYIQYSDLILTGKNEEDNHPNHFTSTINSIQPDTLATIIYTSGTTGMPKGAMISNKAIVQMLNNVKTFSHDSFSKADRTLTFLPLSHVFGRCDSLLPLIFGWEIVYARSIEKLFSDLKTAKPTLMLAVPRIFEKINTKILARIKYSGIHSRVFRWALKVSNQYHRKIESDKAPSALEIINYQLAYKLVFADIYKEFGGRIKYFISGGAPLSIEVINLLKHANLTVLEGYGLTETVAPCSLNPFDRQVPGTVGKPIGDVQFHFASDGEILVKSGAMFSGYYKEPELTADSIKNGWLHTGDIGCFDDKGHLKITDRKKDLIITSGGKNIAPQKIETLLNQKSHVTNCAIYGDKKNFVVALIIIDKDSFLNDFDDLGLEKSISMKDMSKHPKIQSIVWEEIDEVNDDLARYEQIKKFIIVDTVVSTENYLTPSLKLKKKNLFIKYENAISALYK